MLLQLISILVNAVVPIRDRQTKNSVPYVKKIGLILALIGCQYHEQRLRKTS